MTKKTLTIALLSAIILTSCSENTTQENPETKTETTTEKVETITSVDENGKELQLTFNNTEGKVTLIFEGETIVLLSEKPASGIWYKSDQYELRGKGNDIVLKKDGEVIFTHQDDIVHYSLKNKEGQSLDMTFNNTENTVKVYLDGGEQIDLKGEKAASGIWCKNDQYELRGKGNDLELTKDGKTVFEN
jgi:membrane-bound inhibitor of C-type lysozyme